MTAGQSVYFKTSDSKWWKAASNSTAAVAGSAGIGVALNGGAAGQTVTVQTGGRITIGATVAVGQIYVVSATSGGICPVADLASTNYVTVVGYGATTSVILLDLNYTAIQKA